jgi:hypothetical protein
VEGITFDILFGVAYGLSGAYYIYPPGSVVSMMVAAYFFWLSDGEWKPFLWV